MSHNFWNKNTVIIFMSFAYILLPFSFDTVLAISGIINSSFIDNTPLTNSLISAMYALGMGLGHLLFGPLFDIRGRKEIFIFGMLITVISAILVCFAININYFLLTRFFHGLGVSTQLLGVRCIISDYFSNEKESARAYSIVYTISFVGALLAPIFAVWLVQSNILLVSDANWHIVFIQFGLIALIIMLILFVFPETNLNPSKKSYMEIISSYKEVYKNHDFILYSLLSSLFVSWLYLYFLSISFIMQDLLKIDSFIYAIILSVNMAFGAIGSIINDQCLKKYSLDTMLNMSYKIFLVFSVVLTIILLDFDLVLDIGNYYKAYSINFCLIMIMLSFAIASPNLIVKMLSTVNHQSRGNAIVVLGIMQFGIGAFVCNIIGLVAITYTSVMAIGIGMITISLLCLAINYYTQKTL